MLNSKLLGGTAAAKTYIEDVFSTWLYNGNGFGNPDISISNGIDLSGKGGLIWLKRRDSAADHFLFSTATSGFLASNSTAAIAGSNPTFNSTGFSLTAGLSYSASGSTNASWTFRKAAKFFDVVTYTGNGSSSRQIAHNLGSVPGCIIVKNLTDAGEGWVVQHRSLTTGNYLELQSTNAAAAGGTGIWNNTLPTSTVFTVGASNFVNRNGANYVAYLFAHDTGTDGLIQCGTSTSGTFNNLGWEPQWVLAKPTTNDSWYIYDNMRGLPASGTTPYLNTDLSNAEANGTNNVTVTATGFTQNLGNCVWIAIRRGPMRTPTDATKVFAVSSPATGTYTTTTNFPIDSAIVRSESTVADWQMMARLTGNTKYLNTNATVAESTSAGAFNIDSNTSFTQNLVVTNPLNYILRRAPGFFDVVAYTGTGSATTISHNLGVAPELMIVKRRNAVASWLVYSLTLGATKYLSLNTTAAEDIFSSAWNNTAPTASVFSVGDAAGSNASGGTYIAYLFTTLPGVSKVGSYTGTGTTKQIDCGFTAGARFVLIKRTDSTGDWYVWDTARGIVSGNDSYLLLNSTAAEVTNTDYIDPLNSGFEISSTAPAAINANGGTFIYLAIA